MFEKLLIQNFQAHERIKIEFDPKVTTIVGDNDVGKSSIIRALKWICLNKSPKGQFIRYGKRGSSVKLFVDGNKIGRSKTPSSNTYTLNGDEFKSFGTKVPDPISHLLNVDEVSFQGQHDGPFWFSLTAGEVSRRLNAIVDLNVIDESLSSIASRCRRNHHAVEIAQERLKKAEDKRDSLKWVEEANREYQTVEEAERKADKLVLRCEILSDEIRSARKRRKAVREALTASQSGERVVQSGREFVRLQKQCEQLSITIESARHHEFLKNREIPDFSAIFEGWENYHVIMADVDGLKRAVSTIRRSREKIERLDGDIEAVGEKAKSFVGKKCPVCGQEVDNEAVMD